MKANLIRKLADRIDLQQAVMLLKRGQKTVERHEWEQGETEEAWSRAVSNYLSALSARLEYERESKEIDHA